MIPLVLVSAPLLCWLTGGADPAFPARAVQWGALGVSCYALGGYVRLRRRDLIPPVSGVGFLTVLALCQAILALIGALWAAWALSGPSLILVRRLSTPVFPPLVHGRVWGVITLAQAGAAASNFIFPGL